MLRPNAPERRRTTIITLILAVVILTPSMIAFAGKFMELVHVFRVGGDGAFAITPVANYLCASLGFFCLLLWAARNGMFRDMEKAKYTMLQREQELDR